MVIEMYLDMEDNESGCGSQGNDLYVTGLIRYIIVIIDL